MIGPRQIFLCQDDAYLLYAYRNVVVIELQHQCSPPSVYCRKAWAFQNGPAVCISRRFMELYSTTTARTDGLCCAARQVWSAPAVQEESDYQRSVRVRSGIRPLSEFPRPVETAGNGLIVSFGEVMPMRLGWL